MISLYEKNETVIDTRWHKSSQ